MADRAGLGTALHIVRLLALVVWVGGVIFFAFGVAPVAFGRLPSAHEAGLVVGASLRVLHRMGLVSGVVFLAASVGRQRGRAWAVTPILVATMLVLTAASQWVVQPKMELDRVAAGGAIEAADAESEPKVDFQRLHRVAETMESGVLLLGVLAIGLTGAEGFRREQQA